MIKMKDGKDLLNSVLKTTQMGQIGIRSVLKNPVRPTLRMALNGQLQEYDHIEKDDEVEMQTMADKILKEFGVNR